MWSKLKRHTKVRLKYVCVCKYAWIKTKKFFFNKNIKKNTSLSAYIYIYICTYRGLIIFETDKITIKTVVNINVYSYYLMILLNHKFFLSYSSFIPTVSWSIKKIFIVELSYDSATLTALFLSLFFARYTHIYMYAYASLAKKRCSGTSIRKLS